MSKTDVLALIADLSQGTANQVIAEGYYFDVIKDLGERGILTQATLLEVTANDATYTLPATGLRLLGAFYSDNYLCQASIQEVEAYAGTGWRDVTGDPIAYVVEDESKHDFRLFPKPAVPSDNFIFLFGSPFGKDFLHGAVAVIHTETRNDLPVWLELPVVFEVLSREFSRESDHKDLLFAKICQDTANMFFEMVL